MNLKNTGQNFNIFDRIHCILKDSFIISVTQENDTVQRT